ncbi:MAG: hypothetical protein HYY46_25880 [Deltaproteobacteria bacterium]|nr:hypothetical protein [Deltaproteobacteria bacterium]
MNMRGDSLAVAFDRFGRGLLGGWCIIGPITLINAQREFVVGPMGVLFIFVLIFYAIAVWKWQRQGLSFIKAVGKDTPLFFVFSGVGGAISGVVAALGGPALHRGGELGGLMLVFPLLGFWILEARRGEKKADL